MQKQKEDILVRLATGGLEDCLRKMNTVSPGVWRLETLRIFPGGMADALGRRSHASGGEAIRITVKSVPPMITLLMFFKGDAAALYRCFVGEQFYAALGAGMQEVGLLELGNVLLNAMANSLLKAFKKSAIPSVPERVAADPESVAAPHHPPAGAVYTIISADIRLGCGGGEAAAEVVAIVPEALADGGD